MRRPKSAISERLSWASVALANAAEAEILARISVYGFNLDRLTEGRGFQQRASEAVTRQVAAAGELRTATARLQRELGAAKAAYQGLARASRTAFKRSPDVLVTLGLVGAMPRTQASFITMSLALFDNAIGTPAVAEALGRYGYTAERLAAERAKIVALIEARRAQGAANGAAQQATADQNAALAALEDEMSALRTMAKVALRDQPQLLEKLGIVQRSSRTAAQRAGAKKAASTRKRGETASAPPAG